MTKKLEYKQHPELKCLMIKNKSDTWDSKCKKMDFYLGRIRSLEAWKFIRTLK